MSLKYNISFLDKCPIANNESSEQAFKHTLELVKKLEILGFSRYWLAEHHASEQYASTSPELLIAWLLPQTHTIRLGSGGVMLQHYSPYKVAENFNLLATLGKNRVDLGVGKAPGGMPVSTKALQYAVNPSQKGTFQDQLTLLNDYLQGKSSLTVYPKVEHPAEYFLLGGSEESALLAAKLNWNFVFAAHLNGDIEKLRKSLQVFKQKAPQRTAIIALQIIIAETEKHANELAKDLEVWTLELEDGQRFKVLNKAMADTFAQQANKKIISLVKEPLTVLKGTAQQVISALDQYYQNFPVDEFILDIPLADHKQRQHILDLLIQHLTQIKHAVAS
ncbi:MsnO8 family LLM class oxidoreductase [Acinetobacter sp. ESL0695]|uniref:MsnO8 family LLM class oxidoreductase n=1 Tax=Acinetobacter sp. ESL0695 TaxID=2983215 RepID=UPI0023F30A28|nr:MsnO8 family LLM class oxidoreductase [Acinetobacter sp. ESL0695]WEV47849.1 MsnO8 family LLM class oxidoreductase [Acinetobacter sp. ESL0695]